ncbi:hypothetical protein MGN01_23850 [Methylobacterium gnaphalii]|uniref:Uncharacterized protein n=1 Tax=Methylobacterium gnaphalii TaxID=1010610 RepID=A0A512JKS2_9HYPH|nr:hypothetical protein MGN01_23850 [Methylobacterium gnaphalii]GLS47896.1 hypothetical protein GCM10007885_07400 [Methylobacterium gnaphalii]
MVGHGEIEDLSGAGGKECQEAWLILRQSLAHALGEHAPQEAEAPERCRRDSACERRLARIKPPAGLGKRVL